MSKFAFAPDLDFSYNRFLDYTGNKTPNDFSSASAFSWVVPANELGVRDAQLYDLCGNATNLAAYSLYGDALLRGAPSNVLKPDTPLGVRYFMPSGGDVPKRCAAPDGTVVNQYYVVDGLSKSPITLTSTSGSSTYKGNSIIFSAAAILNNIDTNRITPFYQDNHDAENSITFLAPDNDLSYNKCKKIQIVTDAAGNTESNYVSEKEAAELIKSEVAKEAFHTRAGSSFQQSPMIVHGHDGVWSRHSSSTHLGGGYFIGAIRDSDSRYIQPKDIEITPMHSSYASIDDSDDVDYVRAQQWLQDQIAIRDESREAAKKGYDAITGFFLGSVTVLGLFIVFKFLDIQSATRITRR